MYEFVNYRKEAISTESPVNKDMERRLLQMWSMVEDLSDDMIELSGMLDRVKRVVYYNKPDEELESQIPPMPPTGEKRERIEQLTRFMHGLIGIIGECGEACEPIKKFVGGQISEADIVNLKEELGDMLWYLNLMAVALNTDLISIAEANIAKLRTRFPNKFSEFDAVHRNLSKERAVLDDMLRKDQ